MFILKHMTEIGINEEISTRRNNIGTARYVPWPCEVVPYWQAKTMTLGYEIAHVVLKGTLNQPNRLENHVYSGKDGISLDGLVGGLAD